MNTETANVDARI